ncbi:hypothetical protein ACLOJK_024253 [Asimina triloba]
MTRKKGMIIVEDLASLRLHYHISDLFKLSAPSEGETLRSHHKGYVILGCVSFAGKRNTKIVSNLPDLVLEWKLWFFYTRFRVGKESTHIWGILMQLNNELSEVQRPSSFWGLKYGSPWRIGGAVWPLVRHSLLLWGSRALASGRADDRARLVDCLKKRKHLVNANKDVEEDLERRNGENLQLGLALSRKEACCSSLVVLHRRLHQLVSLPALLAAPPEVPSDPIPEGSSP